MRNIDIVWDSFEQQRFSIQSKFKDQGYLLIENFLNDDICDFLYGYLMVSQKRLDIVEKNKLENSDNRYGEIKDKTFITHGDLTFDSILVGKRSEIEWYTGYDLVSTYTTSSIYNNGAELLRHTDDDDCELTLSICLGYDTTKRFINEDKTFEKHQWPFWIKDNQGNEIEVFQKKGGAILYKGTECEHWRNKFEGTLQGQLDLHFNDKDGDYGDEYNKRLYLGLPSNG
tara:strand:+ start:54 stop:737 length:684 start_codon:yes stop_codon:yes gene_type:complete